MGVYDIWDSISYLGVGAQCQEKSNAIPLGTGNRPSCINNTANVV